MSDTNAVQPLNKPKGFVTGIELSRSFYLEIVRPLISERPHIAARLGKGSEVLGFDTPRSTDHGWGPQLQVFVGDSQVDYMRSFLDVSLPESFRGWPVRFGWDQVPIQHHVDVIPFVHWLEARLGFNPELGISTLDWLVTPQQLLLEVTSGAVFNDVDGRLDRVRQSLAWFPDDIWLWLLACQWRRLEQEEPFVGRTSEVGDELGSRIIASRIVRDLMRLCFLLERKYTPYMKWLGTAFKQLDMAVEMGPRLESALESDTYSVREASLCSAYEYAAHRFNELQLVAPVHARVRMFHARPYRVLGCERFVKACLEGIQDQWLKRQALVGSIDQTVDCVDILSYPDRIRQLSSVYEDPPDFDLE